MSPLKTHVLAFIGLLATGLTSFAAEQKRSFNYNTVAEIKVAEFVVEAFDLNMGVLYFSVDGTRLCYMPQGGDDSARVTAVASILTELRKARLVVVSFYKPPAGDENRSQDGSRYFPAYALEAPDGTTTVMPGANYRSVGAFYLKY